MALQIPLKDKPFIWVDTETTGLDPLVHEVIDIAILREELDGRETVINLKIKPDCIETAAPVALSINGYTPEAWADAADAREAWASIHESKILYDGILAGQNVGFDAAFINASLSRYGIDGRVDYHLYDTVTLILEHLKPALVKASLAVVCRQLGIPVDGAHQAMTDVLLARTLHQKLARCSAEDRAEFIRMIEAATAI